VSRLLGETEAENVDSPIHAMELEIESVSLSFANDSWNVNEN